MSFLIINVHNIGFVVNNHHKIMIITRNIELNPILSATGFFNNYMSKLFLTINNGLKKNYYDSYNKYLNV